MRALLCLLTAGMLAAVPAFAATAATVGLGQAFDTLYRIDLAQGQASEVGSAGRLAGRPVGNLSGLTTGTDGRLYAVTSGVDFKFLLGIDGTSGAASAIGDLGLAGQGQGQYDALDLNMSAACAGDLWLVSAVARKLWRVDAGTGKASLVGATGAAITGIVEHDGILYGAGGRGDNQLYRLDPATGRATPIGPFGPGLARWANSVSLAFDAAGTLWAVVNYVPPHDDNEPLAAWNDLASIDPRTGALTLVGPIKGPESLREIGMRGFTLGPPSCKAMAEPDLTPVPVDARWALALLAMLLAVAAALRARAGTRRH